MSTPWHHRYAQRTQRMGSSMIRELLKLTDGLAHQLIHYVYRERRDIMLAAMSEHFPPGVRWTRPEGGLFLWVTLPDELDSTAVLEEAINHKVAYVPGAAFYPDGKTRNNFRLNFSNAQSEQIQEGIARLGQVLHNVIEPLPVY